MGQGSNSVRTQDCRSLIAQYRRDLEVALQRREVRGEMQRLRETCRVFGRYPSIEELAALVGPSKPNEADRDAVLRALLVEIKRQPTLFPLLNWVFWPSLLDIFWRKVHSCPNADDLLSQVRADFYEVAVTYPLHRPGSIGGNLYWDTWKKVAAWQQEEAKYRGKHEPLGPAHELGMLPADLQESEVFPEDFEPYLRELVLRNVITQAQCDLLLETAVYGRLSEKEWAKARGVNPSTVRTWRHRAEKAIRKHEEEKRS